MRNEQRRGTRKWIKSSKQVYDQRWPIDLIEVFEATLNLKNVSTQANKSNRFNREIFPHAYQSMNGEKN